MKAWATRRYARCIASQVIEDGVGRGRRAEAIGANTVMHPDKLWYTLIARKILGNVHRYREVHQHHYLCVSYIYVCLVHRYVVSVALVTLM